MARPTSKQQEALQLLDDLENISGTDVAKEAGHSIKEQPGQAADILAFLDEVTQHSAEPVKATPSRLTISRPSSRASNPPSLKKKSFEASRSSNSSPIPDPHPTQTKKPPISTEPSLQSPSPNPQPIRAGWGWSNVWSTTTAALQQAKTAVDGQVRTLSTNEQARRLQEGVIGYVKTAQLDKLGKDLKDRSLSAFNEILNAVAPPISEHEVLRVSLSHDMQGYDGVESIVYQALAKVMEQVESGDLIVNQGSDAKPKYDVADEKNMNVIDGLESAVKLAKAAIEESLKNAPGLLNNVPEKSNQNPTTVTHLYMRLQPFTSKLPTATSTSQDTNPPSEHLQFYIYLHEPSHGLSHHTISQAIPLTWMEAWNSNEWVEDLIVETLRLGVQTVGQEYIISRMGTSSKSMESVSGSLARKDKVEAQ